MAADGKLIIPRWGLWLMLVSSIVGAVLLALQIMGRA